MYKKAILLSGLFLLVILLANSRKPKEFDYEEETPLFI